MASTVLNAWIPFINVRDAILDSVTKLCAPSWQTWFLALWGCVNLTPQQRKRVTVSTQGASIAATDISLAAIPARIYHVGVFARVTRAGSVSSSLNVTIRGIDDGVTYDRATGAVTTNTTGTNLCVSFPMRIDKDGPIQYLVTYADGGGANNMLYDLEIVVFEWPS